MTARTHTDFERTWIGGGGVLLTTGLFALAGGFSGLVAGALLAGIWYRLPSLYAVAFGHLALAALVPETPAVAPLLAAELGLFAMLVAPARRQKRSLELAAATLLGVVALGVLVRTGLDRFDALWPTAALLALAVALLAYGLHRYELLATGQLEGTA